MKILVTGSTGIIGRYLLRQIGNRAAIVATYFRNKTFKKVQDVKYCYLDITAKDSVTKLFKMFKPEVVVHIASIGNVDFAEKYKQKARLVNVEGTNNVVEAAKVCDTKFIFISSNAVFDGERPPYNETNPANPINYYGKLKLEGERIVASSGLKYAIVRPILTYGWNDPHERPNPVTWLLSELKNKKRIKIVNDIYCNPLLANNCAEAIWSIVQREKNGIFHIGGKDRINRFDFAVQTAKTFGLDWKLIEPVPNSYFKNIAPRPRDTTYSTEKMKEELGVSPVGIDDGLQMMLAESHGHLSPAGDGL